MRVLCLEDCLQFRLLAVACGEEPDGWLEDFLAPEGIGLAEYLKRLRELGRPWQVEIVEGPEAIGAAHADVETLAVEHHTVDDELLDRLPRLTTVALLGQDATSVDLEACRRRGIVVRTAFRATTAGVADHVFLLLLVLSRQLLHGALLSPGEGPSPLAPGRPKVSFEEGDHPPTVFNWLGVTGISALAGRRMAVFGAGEIGSEVLRRAAAFDMELGYCSRRRRPSLEARTGARPLALEELPDWADVVSLHVGYHPTLRHVVDRNFLGALGPKGLLLNTSRGRLVDHVALVEALESGAIAGAGLDVFETEPLPADDPLRRAPRVVLTPHVGGGSRWELVPEVGTLVKALTGEEPE